MTETGDLGVLGTSSKMRKKRTMFHVLALEVS
jgi:hypothetical protein